MLSASSCWDAIVSGCSLISRLVAVTVVDLCIDEEDDDSEDVSFLQWLQYASSVLVTSNRQTLLNQMT
ncbi:hypothetical protein QVD17_27710 [Tagetes erecta]|uniref:Uncharacterized protein n=1 Tax=Tagetes erecta TaxID=13708 RepID=A0AAD8K902_TARER|nr:hypothetical protein QVD17_27710 [Tagetes erecta]